MKEKIHPEYHNVIASCACGATFVTSSNEEEVRVDICSHCHPLFTGQQKLLDSEGRVERFKKRYAAAGTATKSKKKS
jgi:large subunit ribosomal protein L31